ncbi:hypothetical protein KM043_001365 [Ampulex compressa]|nr:hypothetical protein KM043_001365 [Ampulex compressa]
MRACITTLERICHRFKETWKSDTKEVTVEPVAGRFGLGEGPHWDHHTQKLYFVDIFGQKICRLDPATGTVTYAFIENGPVGNVVTVDDMPDKFVAGSDTDSSGTRWNDGKVDSTGRFWGGTMGIEAGSTFTLNKGSMYSIDSDLVPKQQISPVSISNGIAWNIEDNTLYYIDSLTYQVTAYDYDPNSGNISNKRIIFDVKKNNLDGLPDGMTVDTEGNLWVALYGGNQVIQINPKTGELLRSVKIPAKNVTSVAFGGPLLNTLYVTTSSYGLDADQLKADPKAGYIFAVHGLGVRGLLANSFKLNV